MTSAEHHELFINLIPGVRKLSGSAYTRGNGFTFFLNINKDELGNTSIIVDGIGFDRTRWFNLSDPELQIKIIRYLDVVIDPPKKAK